MSINYVFLLIHGGSGKLQERHIASASFLWEWNTQALVTMFLGMFRTAFFLVSIYCCCSFYWCHGCLQEERTILLQIKDSINYPGGSSLDKVWVGKNYCKWDRVECNPSSSKVILINLYLIREERLRLWYPNTSLFAAFKELEGLSLLGNHIGGWVMPQGKSTFLQFLLQCVSIRYLVLGPITTIQFACITFLPILTHLRWLA